MLDMTISLATNLKVAMKSMRMSDLEMLQNLVKEEIHSRDLTDLTEEEREVLKADKVRAIGLVHLRTGLGLKESIALVNRCL